MYRRVVINVILSLLLFYLNCIWILSRTLPQIAWCSTVLMFLDLFNLFLFLLFLILYRLQGYWIIHWPSRHVILFFKFWRIIPWGVLLWRVIPWRVIPWTVLKVRSINTFAIIFAFSPRSGHLLWRLYLKSYREYKSIMSTVHNNQALLQGLRSSSVK